MKVFDVDSHGNIVELDFLQVTVTKIDREKEKKIASYCFPRYKNRDQSFHITALSVDEENNI